MMIKIYDSNKDEMVEVTQEWCDNAHKALNALAGQRALVRTLLNLNLSNPDDLKILDDVKQIVPIKSF